MNVNTAIATLARNPMLAKSMEYALHTWRLEGELLHFEVIENSPHGGSFHARKCMWVNPYEARCARKVLRHADQV